MADVNRGNRPLSPFMLGKYYRFQLNSVTSILTRITGNAMLVAALMIVWWLLAAATSAEYFALADYVLTSYLGDLVLFLSLWGMWYHLLAGVRHLIWDAAIGLDVPTATKLGYAVVGGSLFFTLFTVAII
ncbi:succinate dehydrogenase, cytochrome b556 subunit [Pseudoprimorskyibacter insulae]|uniref:Succinate dehydrogenase cytochrome b556 subunit n=1 Tax=Pseudoprimorskyibacter insulae TaxID=1695997 RepID=A0A2R8APB7_9RHOB|nr:succinate dehydrogenase, cytochrome b556 subunit [Pseudoprimorskyibacter insulae]SPF77830.1 Succinate dehydrogenase cytochrome b556 subunit [Pseudoprimorskyibacter insulae]